MKIALVLIMTASYFLAAQDVNSPNGGSDIKVLSVSVKQIQRRTRILHGQISSPTEKTIPERSSDLSQVEANARMIREAPIHAYAYEIKIQYSGPKKISSIGWQYASGAPDQDDSIARRFLCKQTLKPGGTAVLRAISHLPPTRVMKAGTSPPNQSGHAIVGRIEYQDGNLWKLRGWTISAETSEMLAHLSAGSCMELF